MSALTVLYLVLPFPIAFILHDAEEVMVQHRWMLNRKEVLNERFPKTRHMVVMQSIWNAMSGTELTLWCLTGVITMVANFIFIH